MELLPQDLIERLPKLGETAEQADPLVLVKFFYPDFLWTWYGIEFDGEDEFYGMVDGFERELGPFSLAELKSNCGKLGCPIERDMYFQPVRLSELFDGSRLGLRRRE